MPQWMTIATAALALAGATAAAADDARPVTLAEVVAAVPRAPAAQVAGPELRAAEAEVAAAGAWPSPSVRVGVNRLSARLAAGVTVPLPLFGTVGAAEREAGAAAAVARAEAEVGLRGLERRAVAAWVALARAGGEAEAAAISARQAGELERIARGRLDADVAAKVDVTVAGAARARADVEAATARRGLAAASAELAGVLGWPPGEALAAAGAPAVGAARALPSLTSHPERAAAARRVAAAEARIDAVARQRYPSLAVEAQLSALDPTTPGIDAMLGLALDLPLFARTGDRVRAAEARAAAERARLAVTDVELGAALVAAYQRWQGAGQRLVALERDVLPAQEQAATLSMQAYREGARDLASALTAERDLATVRAEVAAARADAAAAYAELQVAAGEHAGAVGSSAGGAP